METFKKIMRYIWIGLKGTLLTISGAVSAIFHIIGGIIGLTTLMLVVCGIIGIAVYLKVKPDFEKAREIAYDKLATMDVNSFSMLSDTEIYDKDGNQIGLINAGHYEYTDITDISMHIQNGYIAVEDRRFKEHAGVDYISILRAGLALVKHNGEITQGGSTITQQVVKNTMLTQEQTFTRKMTEIMVAPYIEQRFGKDKIMEFYCNTNFYGNRCYGVQSASRYYFGKKASDLDVWEAAMLVGLSNSPGKYDPIKHPEDALDKRNRVLDTMAKEGYIENDKLATYKSKPLSIVQETQEGTEENYQSSYAIHCAALELMKNDEFNFRYTFRDKEDYDRYKEKYNTAYSEKSDLIRAGGYKIYTTLDSTVQEQLQQQIDGGLSKFTELQENGKFALQGAGVVVDNQTNNVIAIVGGRGTEDQFNRGYLSARQPGSTIKPLIDYGPAFDTGEFYPSKIIDDHKWEDGPSNSGSYYGNVTIREALNRSLNTVAWQVLQQIGVDKGLEYLDKMQFLNISYIDNGVEALSIGGFTNGLRVVDMAKGYSTLANSGVYDDRTCITSIIQEKEGELYKSTPKQSQVFTEDTAFMVTDILKGTFGEIGTGRGLDLGNMPAAGKTGTTNSNKDTWFCGYSRYYTTAIWVGYDTPRAMPGVFGATYAGRIWSNFMKNLHNGLEPLDWEQPETVYMAPYNLADGKEAASGEGQQDYFSSTGKIKALEVKKEREDKERVAVAEKALSEFESFNIQNVEDTYTIGERYNKVTEVASLINNEADRKDILSRASAKYSELTKVVSEWKDTIEEYEEQKIIESEEAKEVEESKAVEARKQQEIDIAVSKVRTAIKELQDMKYKDSTEFNRITDNIKSKLADCEGMNEYSALNKEVATAIQNYDLLPTYDVWYKNEQARLAEEQRKADEQKRLEEAAKESLESLIDEKKDTSKGPGANSNSNSTNGPSGGPGETQSNSGPGGRQTGPGVN